MADPGGIKGGAAEDEASRNEDDGEQQHQKKILYERERRERFSVRIRELGDVLVACGVARKNVGTQLDSIEAAIAAIRSLAPNPNSPPVPSPEVSRVPPPHPPENRLQMREHPQH